MNYIAKQCDDLEDHLKHTQILWNAALDVWHDRTRERFSNEYWISIEYHIKELVKAGRELSSTVEFIKSQL